MVLGCLLWWGDVVEESEDALLESDWRLAVRDVSWALKESIVGVGNLYVTLTACGDGV
jgi:chromosome condensin MukBEF complex kleisin-like MukF subunit